MKGKRLLVLSLFALPLILSGCGNNDPKPNEPDVPVTPDQNEDNKDPKPEDPKEPTKPDDKPQEVKKDFTNIKFEDKSVSYDGETHTLVATNVPEGAKITYINAGPHKNIGTYEITVKITKNGYNDFEKKATLTIVKGTHAKSKYTLESLTIDEDYKDHIDDIAIVGELTNTSKVTTTVTKDGNVVKEAIDPGTYNYEVKITDPNYHEVVLTATLVINDVPASEAKFKEAFAKTIKAELETKRNYTYKINGSFISGGVPEEIKHIYSYDKDSNKLYSYVKEENELTKSITKLESDKTIVKSSNTFSNGETEFLEKHCPSSYFNYSKEDIILKVPYIYGGYDYSNYISYDLDTFLRIITNYSVNPNRLKPNEKYEVTLTEKNNIFNIKLFMIYFDWDTPIEFNYEMTFNRDGIISIKNHTIVYADETKATIDEDSTTTLVAEYKKDDTFISSFANFENNEFRVRDRFYDYAKFVCLNQNEDILVINDQFKIGLIPEYQKFSNDIKYECYYDIAKTRKIDLSTFMVPTSNTQIFYDYDITENKTISVVYTYVYGEDNNMINKTTEANLVDANIPYVIEKTLIFDNYEYDINETAINEDIVVDGEGKPCSSIQYSSSPINILELSYTQRVYQEVQSTYEVFNEKFMNFISNITEFKSDFTITSEAFGNVIHQLEYDKEKKTLNGIDNWGDTFTTYIDEQNNKLVKKATNHNKNDYSITNYSNASLKFILNNLLNGYMFYGTFESKTFQSILNSNYINYSLTKNFIPDVELTESYLQKGNDFIYRSTFKGHNYQKADQLKGGTFEFVIKANNTLILNATDTKGNIYKLTFDLKNNHIYDKTINEINTYIDANPSEVTIQDIPHTITVLNTKGEEIAYVHDYDGTNFVLPEVYNNLPEGVTARFALDESGTNLVKPNEIPYGSTVVYFVPIIPKGKILVLNNIERNNEIVSSYFELLDLPQNNDYKFNKQIIDDKGQLRDPSYIYHYNLGEEYQNINSRPNYYVNESEFYMFKYAIIS